MKKRVVAVILLVAVGTILFWAAWERFQKRRNYLVVENRSGQPIAQLRITISQEAIRFEDVPDGIDVTAPFRIGSDDHFVVVGRLADGTNIGGDFGYVTNGMAGERAHFFVERRGVIEFDQSKRVSVY